MPQSIQHNATRANARTAAAAAGIVAAVMVAQTILSTVISIVGNLGYSSVNRSGGLFDQQTAYYPILGSLQTLIVSVLPISVGVFLAFWVCVPLAAELRIGQVVSRSFVASAIASAVSLVISIAFAVGGAVVSAGSLFGNSFPVPDGTSLFYSLFGAIQQVFYTFLSATPLVLLAGVLAWLWVAKTAPVTSTDRVE